MVVRAAGGVRLPEHSHARRARYRSLHAGRRAACRAGLAMHCYSPCAAGRAPYPARRPRRRRRVAVHANPARTKRHPPYIALVVPVVAGARPDTPTPLVLDEPPQTPMVAPVVAVASP